MKISEILHKAADVYLWDGMSESGVATYSCCAVLHAVPSAGVSNNKLSRIYEGLAAMGLDIGSVYEFNEFPAGEQRQAARYAWLKFAAMIAEEQGV